MATPPPVPVGLPEPASPPVAEVPPAPVSALEDVPPLLLPWGAVPAAEHASHAAIAIGNPERLPAAQLMRTEATSATVERKKKQRRPMAATSGRVAGGVAPGTGLVGALDHAGAILARVVTTAPAARAAATA